MKYIKFVLLAIWQLPQNILGALLLLFYYLFKNKPKYYLTLGDVFYFYTLNMPSGISLGNIVIMNYPLNRRANDTKHEFGHSIQSKILGFLYLIIIGVFSLAGNVWDRLFHKKWDNKKRTQWYYNLPWEKWADKLGGVKR
mgnify:CR=1 FL=1